MRPENFYPLSLTHDPEELVRGGKKVEYIWDLIKDLGDHLEADFKKKKPRIKGKVHPSAVLYNKKDMQIEAGAEVEVCAVLDARGGPIYIGKGAIIKPQSYLRGPLSIGEGCRIGGEVTHSIILDYTNKAHYGFIGHSYIGSWVNLGAGTTNSNLKNNYGSVKVSLKGREINTGMQFLGCLIGDHVKTGIGTLISTGAVIGVGANVFGGKLAPKAIPDFAWGEKEKYRWEDFLETARKVMQRRGKTLSEKELRKLKSIYDLKAG
jgi:NDP-sugar pyrophosphorylase family protein